MPDAGPAAAPADQATPAGDVTPLMAQYHAIKAEHADCLLFYRMGDFFELFFDDAVAAAAALDIALTRRGKHAGQDIPMCGVPVASHESYLARLIRRGFKVAICEQVEDPAAARRRGPKAVVARQVVRVVTAGTLTEDSLLEARQPNFLAAIGEAGGELALAWLDVSTGELNAQRVGGSALAAALVRIEPKEILIAEPLSARSEMSPILADWRAQLTVLPASRFDGDNGRRRLQALFGVATLDGFGQFAAAEIVALGALADYVALTQRGQLPPIRPPISIGPTAIMEIDAATRRNLELTRTLAGERRGSLIDVIDATLTAAGARLLLARLSAPLVDPAEINRRLDAVQFFVEAEGARTGLRRVLAGMADLERALTRLGLGRGGPRDLAAIRDGLKRTEAVAAALSPAELSLLPAVVEAAVGQLGGHRSLVEELDRALAAELPATTREGHFIAAGYRAALDETRRLRDEGRVLVAGLESRYQRETGLAALKIRHNNLLGYFVELPAKLGEKLPTSPIGAFFHRQTMANTLRYATVELSELEGRIARAADEALTMELRLFEDLRGLIAAAAPAITAAAQAVATLDVAAALAEVAVQRDYCRPEVDDSTRFVVHGGRHPVVEAAIGERASAPFVANDCNLDDGGRLWLLTGPNMAGKSTFLRQNALIAILAQTGAFVPAKDARIGVVDRLFSRVGAADDLARGRSTFMVEMVETAAILNRAGERALVILDEIGRGTATFDGLSIAWAVIEHLHDVNRCRGLFATHYHELTRLVERLADLACYAMRVKEWRGDVVFLHEVVPGAADRSYGIHVGRLAGLPPPVVRRAEQVLRHLEADGRATAAARLVDDLPLFAAAAARDSEALASSTSSPLADALAAVDPDALTPREALELLYRLKALAPATKS